MSTNPTGTSCDCSPDSGPCENHSDAIYSCEGHYSAEDIDAAIIFHVAQLLGPIVQDEILELASSQWFETRLLNDDERDALREYSEAAENTLPDNTYVYRDGGYVIYRITGGPLFDPEGSSLEEDVL